VETGKKTEGLGLPQTKNTKTGAKQENYDPKVGARDQHQVPPPAKGEPDRYGKGNGAGKSCEQTSCEKGPATFSPSYQEKKEKK